MNTSVRFNITHSYIVVAVAVAAVSVNRLLICFHGSVGHLITKTFTSKSKSKLGSFLGFVTW